MNPNNIPNSESYCILCEKEGHLTTDCHSTHGVNDPRSREIFRLLGIIDSIPDWIDEPFPCGGKVTPREFGVAIVRRYESKIRSLEDELANTKLQIKATSNGYLIPLSGHDTECLSALGSDPDGAFLCNCGALDRLPAKEAEKQVPSDDFIEGYKLGSMPDSETLTVQEVWDTCGGNPGVNPTKADLLVYLKLMDQVRDEADEALKVQPVVDVKSQDADPVGVIQAGNIKKATSNGDLVPIAEVTQSCMDSGPGTRVDYFPSLKFLPQASPPPKGTKLYYLTSEVSDETKKDSSGVTSL